MRTLSHDGFARQELHREQVAVSHSKSCDWCGTKRYMRGRPVLYQYHITPDANPSRRNVIDGQFCCIGCMRDYHRK